MQSAASKRMLSTLAAKIHPQLPLSPRESQQLLTLLTTSFRAHLDREHPLPESSQHRPLQSAPGHNGRRASSPAQALSSYASATQHIDSILTNPLFAVKPRRRGSEPAAVDVLRNPTAWFLNEIATGAATLPKAALCLQALETMGGSIPTLPTGRTFASVLVEWLRTSGVDSSREFVHLCLSKQDRGSWFLSRLLKLLSAQGETTAPWRWYIRSNEQRIKETGLALSKVVSFRQQLLWNLVYAEASTSLDKALKTFMQAFRMAQVEDHDAAYNIIKPAGAHLVTRLTTHQNQSIDPAQYDAFLLSAQRWVGNWNQAVESMLQLHHPTERNALVGLRFIQSPNGAITFVHSSKGRRHFLVQLCLGVARLLLEQDKYEEAQFAMEFAKEHFADLVLSGVQVEHRAATRNRKELEEKKNLELLDHLIPT